MAADGVMKQSSPRSYGALAKSLGCLAGESQGILTMYLPSRERIRLHNEIRQAWLIEATDTLHTEQSNRLRSEGIAQPNA